MGVEETAALVESVNGLTAEVVGKMGQIDERVDSAVQGAQSAADSLGDEARTLMSWVIPDADITLYPAKMVGVDDTTLDSGGWDEANSFNPIKKGPEDLFWQPDFSHPDWTGETNPWRNNPVSVEGQDWSRVQLDDGEAIPNPAWVDLLDLNQLLRISGLKEMGNVSKLRAGKMPFLLMRCTVGGQAHGCNRTFLEVLGNRIGSSSAYFSHLGDGFFDAQTPLSMVYGGGFSSGGYPVAVDGAGYGAEQGHYNTLAIIPLKDLFYYNHALRLVNVGWEKLHIHSYGIAYMGKDGITV